MTDDGKVLSYDDVGECIKNVMEFYMNIFQAKRMSFTEFAILENVLMKLEHELQEKVK